MALATWLEATRRAAPWYAAWMELPSIKDIRDAARRIERHAHRTPVLRCGQLDDLAGRALFFKCENLQKVGAFKFRGGYNALSQFSPKLKKAGVVAYSSGNHAQAIACAA